MAPFFVAFIFNNSLRVFVIDVYTFLFVNLTFSVLHF